MRFLGLRFVFPVLLAFVTGRVAFALADDWMTYKSMDVMSPGAMARYSPDPTQLTCFFVGLGSLAICSLLEGSTVRLLRKVDEHPDAFAAAIKAKQAEAKAESPASRSLRTTA